MDEKKVESIIFGLKETIAEQKAEIERLAKVEMEHIGIIAEQKAEIERLKNFIDFKTANVMCDKCKQQVVKDTAKEICKTIHEDLQATLFNLKHFITDSEGQKAQEQQNIGIIKAQDAVSEFEKTIKERYGVEVE